METPWIKGVPASKQKRFIENRDCKYWGTFQGLNNWKIIRYNKNVQGEDEVVEEFSQHVIEFYSDAMAEKIKTDDVGAFLTEENKADGYYLVKWLGTPYTLQENYVNNDFVSPIVM